jgi:methionyl aminopeptidase
LIVRKSKTELEAMREGGRITAGCLEMLKENVRPGVTTRELDRLAEEFIYDHGGKPEFKGYQGFPASICASPNAMIVHGIPGSYRLKNGDIISLDVGVRYDGFVTDSATTVPVGQVPEEVVGLLGTTRECLTAATEQMRAGNRLGDVGHAIPWPSRAVTALLGTSSPTGSGARCTRTPRSRTTEVRVRVRSCYRG